MRLTINLDDDLHAMARAHAIASNISISKAVSDLLRRRSAPNNPAPAPEGLISIHPISGFPVVAGDNGPLTQEDVHRAEAEDDFRHWSAAAASNATGRP